MSENQKPDDDGRLWPRWSEMDGPGKFFTLVMCYFVLQVLYAIFG